MIILLALLVNSAFAITNFVGCETELVIDQRHTIPLAPNQIALRGKLSEFYEMGCEDSTNWVITDAFIHEEVAPRIDTEVFWLQRHVDYVYLLDAQGAVVAHGHYDEFRKDGKVWFPGKGKMTCLNRPRLNVEPGGDRRAHADYRVLQAFTREEQAVVVRTLTPAMRERLDRGLGPWMRRYDEYAPRATRMRFGDVVVEPKAFEKVLVAPVAIEWRTNSLRDSYLAVAMTIDGETRDLFSSQRLVPLDEQGRALGDFLVKDAGAHEDVLRRSVRVVTLAHDF